MDRSSTTRRIVERLRDLDDWLFERVGPMRVLFVTTDGYGFACEAPIIRALERCPGLKIRVTHNDNLPSHAIGLNDRADLALFSRLCIDARVAAFAKWHVVVYSHVCGFYPRRRALRAYLHHGPGFGSGGGTVGAEMAQIYFGLSVAELDYLNTKRPGLFGSDRAFFAVGFPKSDALINGQFAREAVLREADLPDRRTLLIASSRNPASLLLTLRDAPFRLLAEAFPDWNVVQTGHPWLWQQRADSDPDGSTPLVGSLRAIERRFPNARFLPNVPAEPLAAAADLLVADMTSVITTFSLFDRPIVYFDTPDRPLSAKLQWAAYREAAHVFSSSEDLISACTSAMAEPDSKHAARVRLQRIFYANPGHAADAAASILCDIGRVCSTRSRGWRRVIAMGNANVGTPNLAAEQP